MRKFENENRVTLLISSSADNSYEMKIPLLRKKSDGQDGNHKAFF